MELKVCENHANELLELISSPDWNAGNVERANFSSIIEGMLYSSHFLTNLTDSSLSLIIKSISSHNLTLSSLIFVVSAFENEKSEECIDMKHKMTQTFGASSLKVLHFDDSSIRSLVHEGNFLFSSRDICSILGYSNTSQTIKAHCFPEYQLSLEDLTSNPIDIESISMAEVENETSLEHSYRMREKWLTEPGLYQLLRCHCLRCVFVVPHVHKPHRLHSPQFSVHVYSFNFPVAAFITLWLTRVGLDLSGYCDTITDSKNEEKPITSEITLHPSVIYIWYLGCVIYFVQTFVSALVPILLARVDDRIGPYTEWPVRHPCLGDPV